MTDSREFPLEPEFLKIDGLDIRLATSIKPTAPAVLMLAPWPESLFAFLPVWPTLARDFSLIAVDLPGFGRSQGRADLMSPRAMGDFVIRIADALGVDRFHAIGPDVGSPALPFTAVEHPQRIESLVIGSGATTFPLQIDGVLKAIVEAPNLDDFRKLDPAQVVLGSAAAITNYEVPQAVKDDYVASYAGNRLWDSMAYVRQYPADLAALAPKLAAIETQVQIIVGKSDPYGLAKDAEILHSRLKHSRLNELESGHSVWATQAASYARIAREWIGGGYLRTAG